MSLQRLGALGAVCALVAVLPVQGVQAQIIDDDGPVPYISEVRLAGLAADAWRPNREKNDDNGTVAIGVEVLSDPITLIPAEGSLTRFLLQPRAHIGGTLNLEDGYNFAYAGLTWTYAFDFGLFVDIGFGGAVHDGELQYETDSNGFFIIHGRPNLGSRVLFRESIDIGWDFEGYVVSIFASHVSNAGLADQNDGYDYVGLRVGYPL